MQCLLYEWLPLFLTICCMDCIKVCLTSYLCESLLITASSMKVCRYHKKHTYNQIIYKFAIDFYQLVLSVLCAITSVDHTVAMSNLCRWWFWCSFFNLIFIIIIIQIVHRLKFHGIVRQGAHLNLVTTKHMIRITSNITC